MSALGTLLALVFRHACVVTYCFTVWMGRSGYNSCLVRFLFDILLKKYFPIHNLSMPYLVRFLFDICYRKSFPELAPFPYIVFLSHEAETRKSSIRLPSQHWMFKAVTCFLMGIRQSIWWCLCLSKLPHFSGCSLHFVQLFSWII